MLQPIAHLPSLTKPVALPILYNHRAVPPNCWALTSAAASYRNPQAPAPFLSSNRRRTELDRAVLPREFFVRFRYLLKNDSLFLRSSSAMNCVGAVKVAQELGHGHTIVTILCDSGMRHSKRVKRLLMKKACRMRRHCSRKQWTIDIQKMLWNNWQFLDNWSQVKPRYFIM